MQVINFLWMAQGALAIFTIVIKQDIFLGNQTKPIQVYKLLFKLLSLDKKSIQIPEMSSVSGLTSLMCCCSAPSWPHLPAVGSYAAHACVAVVTHQARVRPTVRSLCAAHPLAAGSAQKIKKQFAISWQTHSTDIIVYLCIQIGTNETQQPMLKCSQNLCHVFEEWRISFEESRCCLVLF